MVGWEKAILEFQRTNNSIDALSSKIEELTLEFFGSPTTTFPKFDGSAALAWLARANYYFLVNKAPLDTRVVIAISAISGAAMPWLHLLLKRCSSLSWDKFTQELMNRFGSNMLERLNPMKSLNDYLEGQDFTSKCSLEIEIRSADIKELSYYESTLEQHACGDDEKVDSKRRGAANKASESYLRPTVPTHSSLHYEAGNAVFKAGEYARVSKVYEQAASFIEGEGTGVCRKGNCKIGLSRTHPYYWHVCSIAVGLHATGNRPTRYWFSGRGLRWKQRRGWRLQTCEGSFDFYLRLEGKAVSRVRQLIRCDVYTSEGHVACGILMWKVRLTRMRCLMWLISIWMKVPIRTRRIKEVWIRWKHIFIKSVARSGGLIIFHLEYYFHFPCVYLFLLLAYLLS